MEGFLQDNRFAVRVLIKHPSFAAIAVITLALGIATNTTIFSWISATLLDPVPGATRPGELVTVMSGEPSEHPYRISKPHNSRAHAPERFSSLPT